MSTSIEFLERIKASGARVAVPKKQLGGNSTFYRFSMGNKSFALKVYKGSQERVTRSRTRETEALKFLNENNFRNIPKVFEELSPEDGICLEFIDGIQPKQNSETNLRILDSFKQLKEIYSKSTAFPDAIDACFSTKDLLSQIEMRIGVSKFCDIDELLGVVDGLKQLEPIDFPSTSITYSMSDIGAHNMLRQGKEYFFLDFEFFGRDSAVKMMIDYLLHPKNQFAEKVKLQNLEVFQQGFNVSQEILIKTVPYFAAKWAMIVLQRLDRNLSDEENSIILKKVNKYIELAKASKSDYIRNKLLSLG